jgi:hypothetical protein
VLPRALQIDTAPFVRIAAPGTHQVVALERGALAVAAIVSRLGLGTEEAHGARLVARVRGKTWLSVPFAAGGPGARIHASAAGAVYANLTLRGVPPGRVRLELALEIPGRATAGHEVVVWCVDGAAAAAGTRRGGGEGEGECGRGSAAEPGACSGAAGGRAGGRAGIPRVETLGAWSAAVDHGGLEVGGEGRRGRPRAPRARWSRSGPRSLLAGFLCGAQVSVWLAVSNLAVLGDPGEPDKAGPRPRAVSGHAVELWRGWECSSGVSLGAGCLDKWCAGRVIYYLRRSGAGGAPPSAMQVDARNVAFYKYTHICIRKLFQNYFKNLLLTFGTQTERPLCRSCHGRAPYQPFRAGRLCPVHTQLLCSMRRAWPHDAAGSWAGTN